ncbi:MAG: FAD-dependent oxidoreductase [Clostridia bacterium]|nr:FAD-dependent oxidoreductase [Clostridia bacterium]
MLIQEEVRERGHYDVIVAGGGVAGVAAAVQLAREGKRALVIEKSQKLGGLATLGLINFFVPMCNGRGKQIIFGMAEEFLRLSVKYGWGSPTAAFVDGQIPQAKLDEYKAKGEQPPRYMCRYSYDIFALTLTELCVNEGVELMFDAVVSTPVCEDVGGVTYVKGVVVENKSGREYYTADYFIDATGDSDLLYRAGIPTASRGNFHTYLGKLITLDSCKRAVETGNIQNAFGGCSGGGSSLYGGGHPEGVPLYYGTESSEVNRYLIQNQLEMLNKLKKTDRNSRDIATLPGMAQFRATRRIVGEYTLQVDDAYRHFDDSVGAINDFDRRDWLYEIPYRTLVNHKAGNIITCGRTASGEGYAWDILRVIPPAIISGQAAGLACAMAQDDKRELCTVDVPAMQKRLEAVNVGIHFDDADIPKESSTVHEVVD